MPMPSQATLELRRLVADGLRELDQERGGRYMGTVARALGVERSTVSRWLRRSTTASVEHCRALVKQYPRFFNEDDLIGLHAQAASQTSPDDLLTVGLSVHETTLSVYEETTRSILRDPGAPEDRVCLHVGFHLDRRGVDAVVSDPLLSDEEAEVIKAFRSAMVRRARDGWKIRSVVAMSSEMRLSAVERMVGLLDGPDVEIRAYVAALPLSLAPLIVGNRDVMLAYDHRRWEKPEKAVVLRAKSVVDWASRYFEALFLDAPYTLRDPHGVVVEELARYRRELEPSSRRSQRPA